MSLHAGLPAYLQKLDRRGRLRTVARTRLTTTAASFTARVKAANGVFRVRIPRDADTSAG